MNKHIETLKSFRVGSKSIFSDLRCEILDALDALKDALISFSKAIYVIVIWLFCVLVIMLALPVATHFRIKWQKDYEDQYNKEFERIREAYNPVDRGEDHG